MKPGDNRCSFCGKKQSEVRLIAGPGVFICSQCVALCTEILAHDLPPSPPGSPQPPSGGWISSLSRPR